jgi:hypothetical protein
MNTREQLNQYLRGLETRLRWLTVSKGAAIGAAVALGVTLAMVLITNALAFSSTSLLIARAVLFLALATAVALGLVLPLMRLNRPRTARRAETAFPQFEQRLLTFVERDKAEQRDPMLDLLAMDTASVAQRTEPTRIAPPRSIFAFATSAGALSVALIWLIMAGPGYFGYGASLLWAGVPKGPGVAFYDIKVEPGDKLIRRKSDQMVSATLSGFQAPQVKLFARYKSTSKWEEAPMLPRSTGSAYEFLFASLPEPVEYYVEAAGVRSKTYKLDVIDLASIKKVKVTYHYPAWLGLPNVTEDPGGDLRAVAGTVAEMTVETDRPLKNGSIEIDDGSHVALEPGQNNTLTAKITISKDGMYHFAANEQGQSVRLSEDYFIEAREDHAPTVKITHPAGDARVSPIEEVQIQVSAEDDFALDSMELHYSVNGTAEKVVPMLQSKGGKTATGTTTIYLEDFKMEPGDVVAVYATAKDARNTARTDMLFIEAQPFEKNYTQSQQGGGGGGGGGGDQEENRISQRQKEIIAATWNEIRGGAKDKVNEAENAKFLSEIQNKLKEQALSLAQRMRSRELAGANQEFQSFVKDMEAAAKEMTPASDKLKAKGWKEALEPEQKALQHLLRAEATFRDIQVAFGNQGGGGGGGGGAGRDLANLFDLELDTEKNQYETGQQQSSSSDQRQKEIDEALQKLEQLARRQQELAQQQKNNPKQSFEQRWQQEQLRRDAEELKKQMEQLSQQGQQGKSSSQSSSSSSSASASSQQASGSQSSSQSGQPQSKSGQQQSQQQQNQQNAQQQSRPQMSRNNTNDQRLQQSLERLRQAQDDMRAAQQAGSQGGQQGAAQAEANARRAAERLKESQDLLNGARRQEASNQLGGLSQRADDLAAHQRDFEKRLRQAFGDQINGANPGAGGPAAAQARQKASKELADEKDKMAGDVDQLEKDMQKAARDMAGTQPGASSRVREGLSELQGNEAKGRMQSNARYIRQGMGGYMVTREAPITQTLDKVAEDLKAAQNALGQGQSARQGTSDAERSLAQLERMRSQMEQMAGKGQQNGQQNGKPNGQQNGQQPGQQNGQNGQPGGQPGQQTGQQNGQQPGQTGGRQGAQQQNGRQFGGNPGNANGGGQWGNQYYNGRFAPEGIYEPNDPRGFDPQRAIQSATRQLNDMRQMFKDNPDLTRQLGDVEREISRLAVGDISSQELQNRLNREVLPNLESLEVQLRRQVENQNGDQVRSGSTDKVPAGYAAAVEEYFRKLSKGKP